MEPRADDDHERGYAPANIGLGVVAGFLMFLVIACLGVVVPVLALILLPVVALVAFIFMLGSDDPGRARMGCGVLVALGLVVVALGLWMLQFERTK